MRTMVEREEEQTDSEVTLSATTLLGIFFGLVLICGVFFGFGYSIGRRGTDAHPAAVSQATGTTADEAPAPTTVPTPKPSAMQTLQTSTADTDTQDSPTTVTKSLYENGPDRAQQTPAPVAPPTPKIVKTAAVPPARLIATPASLPVTTPAAMGSIMVQVAAVSHQEDADALVAGLRQHGYGVSVRNEPQDKLLHVQVGPFATKDAARAMRSKLLADGYNAILKQ